LPVAAARWVPAIRGQRGLSHLDYQQALPSIPGNASKWGQQPKEIKLGMTFEEFRKVQRVGAVMALALLADARDPQSQVVGVVSVDYPRTATGQRPAGPALLSDAVQGELSIFQHIAQDAVTHLAQSPTYLIWPADSAR
jgi:hypothetical protein